MKKSRRPVRLSFRLRGEFSMPTLSRAFLVSASLIAAAAPQIAGAETSGPFTGLTALADPTSVWAVDGGGAWDTPSNWTGAVPAGPRAQAAFLDSLRTPANAPARVEFIGDRTLQTLLIDNELTYVIASPTRDDIVLDNGTAAAQLRVLSGTHRIPEEILVYSDAVAEIRTRLEAGIVRVNDRTATLFKTGLGVLDVGGQVPGAGLFMNGSAVDVQEGIVTTNTVRGGFLTIRSGSRVSIKPNGTASNASDLYGLEIEPGGTLDLADNDLTLHLTPPGTPSAAMSRIIEDIRAARNDPAGRWQGTGLTSSAAAANPLTTLAAVPGLLSYDIVVKYTYNGDATVDGRINADDYFRIDTGFLAQPSNPGFRDGDFNYDGTINADDYFLIDSAFLGQSRTLDAGLRAVAVPEPAGLCAVLAAGLLCRRRRPPT
jgi:hypothetical protein